MAFGWSKTRYSPIAVDFGADSIKLLQVIPSDPPQVITAASAEIPEHARLDPTARYAFFVEALKSLLKSQPFKGNRAILSIPAYHTLATHLQIARVEHEDFDAQIGLQLRQRLNVDPSRMVIRHFDVCQVVRDGSPKQEVICFAASRDAVMRHVESAQRAKLDVVSMTCEPLAILKAFGHLYAANRAEERTTCFIDIGGAATKVIIAHGGQMVFAKTIHAAGDHLTRERAKRDNTSFMDARAARYNEAGGKALPAAQPVPEPVAVGGGEPTGGAFALIDAQIAAERKASGALPDAAPAPRSAPAAQADVASDTLDCLIDELQLCVRYHQSLFPGRTIEKLVFLGGEARHVGTCQKIARSLRIGAQLGDPLARLLRVNQAGPGKGVDINQPQPGWAVPLGLCLSEEPGNKG